MMKHSSFLLIGVPLIFILGSALRGNLWSDFFPFSSLPAGMLAIVLAAIKGPVEEFGCLAISVIATALFNRSGGSILLSAFFHFTLMNPIFPDAQPYDTYLLLAVAGLVVCWNRKSMLEGTDAVTAVIPFGR